MKDRQMQSKLKKRRLASVQNKTQSIHGTPSNDNDKTGIPEDHEGQKDVEGASECKDEEWSGAVLNKTRHERRKPKFLF